MVVLYFSVGKDKIKLNFSSKEFADHLKKTVLKNIDQKRIVPIELGVMKDLVTNNLDSLLRTNDELIRIDFEIETFLRNLEKKIQELDPKQSLTVNIKGVSSTIDDGIEQFSWDESRYPKKQKTIEEILNKINEKFTATSQNLKAKQDEYNSEFDKLKQKMRVDSEALSLMKIDYREVVKANESQMVETDYLCTILCFVPTSSIDFFKKKYYTLADGMVVPMSDLKLVIKGQPEDDKVSLFRVIVMKHAKDTFKQQCQSQLRVVCRDYDKEEILRKPQEAREIENLKLQIKEKKTALIRNSTSGFSEVFYGLLHLKFLRLYVETSLKYGAFDYFYSCIIITPHGREQKLVSSLIKVFNDTSDQGWYGTKEELKEAEDFYPFILIKLGVPSTV